MRFKLTLAYDGRAFSGWQSQPNGLAAQDALEQAIAKVLKIDSARVHGAGRTDAGVHAMGQVAHFDAPIETRMKGEAWVRALNSTLVPALRVMACEEVSPKFHAQYDARGKLYEYRICRLPILPPLEHDLCWHAPYPMNPDLLLQATREVTGKHDFYAFAANRGDGCQDLPGYAVRTIWSITMKESDGYLTLQFHGDGFLYKMVRLLTGSMMRVALGRDSMDWLLRLLHTPNGQRSHHVAPAGGLYLKHVDYNSADDPPDET